jgi:predicted PurR-regulated permease PerM
VGIFVGPVLLAVAYKLLGDWIAEVDAAPTPGGGQPKSPGHR